MITEELKEYISPDYPLLREFSAAAPGTFKHCQSVGNICEMIASELDLDVTFMKVCATYHDIGKINNAKYFSENQEKKEPNPHDVLEPKVSYEILTRHVSDGILILLNNNFPREVLEVISKHHGNSPLIAIYNKAISEDPAVDLDVFRYKCPKANEIYSMILMIVDCVEATARSLSNSGQLEETEDIDNMITNTIKRLTDDMQLDEIKVGILRIVKEKLVREIASIYQKRVPYNTPEEEKNGK